MTPRKKPGEKPGELVAQPHGGALRHGSQPGTNKGGTGRPPSAVRETLRMSFEQRIPILEAIVDCDEAKDSDRIKAAEVMARYGGVDKIALTVEEQPEEAMTPERIAEGWVRIRRVRSIEELEDVVTTAARDQARSGE